MKKAISVSVDEELVKWIDKQIESKRFASRSHAVDYVLAYFIKQDRFKVLKQ